jgi:transposase
MALGALTRQERSVLEDVLRHAADARAVHRAEALLWLDEGENVEEIADRLRVSIRTVYNWADRFAKRTQLSIDERLQDAARSGRPATALGIIDRLIEQIIDSDPLHSGYNASVWTAPLLRCYLCDVHAIAVSRQSVSLALDRLGIDWKRPRHDLSRRAEHWRQAKGGSNAA